MIAELCAFVADAEIIIHNAPCDVGFLDVEFEKLLEKSDGTELEKRIKILSIKLLNLSPTRCIEMSLTEQLFSLLF